MTSGTNAAPRATAIAAAALSTLLAAALPARADTIVEHGAEHRLQLDFHVNDDVLAKMIPYGWTTNIATTGPATDANIRVIFIDRVGVTDSFGRPVAKSAGRQVYLAVPVTGPGGNAGQMIIGGITTNPADVPGPFGNFIAASSASMQRSVTAEMTGAVREETWKLAAASGEHFELHVKLDAALQPKAANETKFFDPAAPENYLTFKVEQVLDISRNAAISVDRVKEYSFSGGGGKFAKLFDGTEKMLSVDSQPWYSRTILKP